jgi:hypothetical protein
VDSDGRLTWQRLSKPVGKAVEALSTQRRG